MTDCTAKNRDAKEMDREVFRLCTGRLKQLPQRSTLTGAPRRLDLDLP